MSPSPAAAAAAVTLPLVAEPEPGPGGSAPASCAIDESYKYVFLPLCYSLTFVFSLGLNSVVLLRSCCGPAPCCAGGGPAPSRRWNTSLTYLVNLAATDLMYGLSLPLLVASYVLRDRWVFGDFACRLVRFLFYFNLYCSIFFLTCISVHRYLGICHPMRTITLESKRLVKWTCALVWVVVFVLTCPIFRFAQTGFIRTHPVPDWNGTRDPDRNGTLDPDGYVNCWDDAIDEEFADYVPYGMVLHLLGFFLPFATIAWCYSQVVRTIFRSLRSPPGSVGGGDEGEGPAVAEGPGRRPRTSVSISGSQYSRYIRRRRKSIRTIVSITLLFALCFLPFHVTRTLFLLLRRRGGGCGAMKTVSVCYKVTRPLASCNAWLNALLYFLTGDRSAASCCCCCCCCCQGRTAAAAGRRDRADHSALWWPLKIRKKEDEPEGEEPAEGPPPVHHLENESKSSRVVF